MTENTQSPEVWRCRECGTENNNTEFCDSCGAPRTGFKFTANQKWPEDGHYPTLDEVRAKEERHGELKEVMWSSSSMGMMMGDISNYSMSLSKEDGAYILMRMKKYLTGSGRSQKEKTCLRGIISALIRAKK